MNHSALASHRQKPAAYTTRQLATLRAINPLFARVGAVDPTVPDASAAVPMDVTPAPTATTAPTPAPAAQTTTMATTPAVDAAAAAGAAIGTTAMAIGMLGSTAGLALGAYHGYKRHHDSVGWALGWGLFGSAIWPLALPIAFAEGFGKPMQEK